MGEEIEEEIDYHKLIRVAAYSGMVLLESNAECYRVEDTMRHILKTSGLGITEANATVKSIYLMLDDDNPEFKAITAIRTIKDKSIDLNRIYKVNNISRDLVSGTITLDEADTQLRQVEESDYPHHVYTLLNILKIPAYTLTLGGGVAEVLIALAVGYVVSQLKKVKIQFGMNEFLYRLLVTFITSFTLTITLNHYDHIKQAIIITASLIPLYPGVSFTNGIRDTLKGDYTSGMARILDAFVVAVSLSIGVILGLYLAGWVLLWLA